MSIKINISGITFAKINANLKYLNTYNNDSGNMYLYVALQSTTYFSMMQI